MWRGKNERRAVCRTCEELKKCEETRTESGTKPQEDENMESV